MIIDMKDSMDKFLEKTGVKKALIQSALSVISGARFRGMTLLAGCGKLESMTIRPNGLTKPLT